MDISIKVPKDRTHSLDGLCNSPFKKKKKKKQYLLANTFYRETFLYSFVPPRKLLSPFFPASSLRWSSDFAQWHHLVSWLAWLLQGCPELCLGDRSPARLPHQNHLRQVPVTTAWAVGVRGESSAVGWQGSWDGGWPAPMLQGQQGQRALELCSGQGQAALALILALVQKWGLCHLGDS